MTGLHERYALSITVLSPVHIGTGERPSEKSRWEGKEQLYVVDEDALLQKIATSPALISRFEQFCLGPDGIGTFLTAERIPAESVLLYNVPRWGGSARRDYFPFIKVPGKPPQPYLPGSSLKGAVRSAFLRAAVLGDAKLRARANDWISKELERPYHSPKRADDMLEKAYFGKDQHHEWPRLYQFTDSQPLTPAVLAVAETRILSIRNEKGTRTLQEKTVGYGGKLMTLFPEVLRPGVKLESDVIFLSYLLDPLAASELRFAPARGQIAYLARQCNLVAQEQILQELDFSKKTSWSEGEKFYGWLGTQLLDLPANGFLLRLGWGAGYDDKTITDLLDDNVFRNVLDGYRLPVGRPGRKGEPLPSPFAPKSRKVALDARGRWLPFGWVRVELKND